MNTNNKLMVDKLKKMVMKTSDIAVGSFMEQVGDKDTMTLAVAIGFLQGLGKGTTQGAKSGAKVLVVLGTANIVYNIALKWNDIRNV